MTGSSYQPIEFWSSLCSSNPSHWLAPFYICPPFVNISKIWSHAFHTNPSFCEVCCSPQNVLFSKFCLASISWTIALSPMIARSLCIIGSLHMLYEYLTLLVGPSEGIISQDMRGAFCSQCTFQNSSSRYMVQFSFPWL